MINRRMVNEIDRTLNVVQDAVEQISHIQHLPLFLSMLPTELASGVSYKAVKNVLANIFSLEKEIEKLSQSVFNSQFGDMNMSIESDEYDLNGMEFESHTLSVSSYGGNRRGSVYMLENNSKFNFLMEKYRSYVEILLAYISESREGKKGDGKNDIYAKWKDIKVNKNLKQYNTHLQVYENLLNTQLHTTVEELVMMDERRNDLSNKQKKLKTDEKSFEKVFLLEKKERRQENRILDVTIKKMKNEIAEYRKKKEDQIKRYNKIKMKELGEREGQYKHHREKLLADITEMVNSLKKAKEANLRAEKENKLKVKNKESLVSDSIQKYDTLMFQNTEEIETLKSQYEDDNKRINFLKKEIEKMREQKEEYIAMMKGRRKEFNLNMRKIQVIVLAKLFCQNMMKKYKEEVESVKKGKKGKGKGKKKGKRKGKKKGKK